MPFPSAIYLATLMLSLSVPCDLWRRQPDLQFFMEAAPSAANGTYADQKDRKNMRILKFKMCEICTQLCSEWRQHVFAFS